MIEIPNLDCDVTSNCQLSCADCCRLVVPYRHADGGIPSTTPAQVEHDLYHFGKIARTKRWAALGGEPLLHRDLVEILRVVRASGVAEDIAVWTNGIRLRRIGADFWQSFDSLFVSVYPGKLTDDDVAWIERKCADEGKTLTIKDERHYPNWTRVIEEAPTDEASTQAKFSSCWWRTYSRTLNYGYLFLCCPSPHIPQLLQGRPFGADGIAIEGLTEQGMLDFLERTKPLGSCSLCAGRNTESAVAMPWREEKNLAAWLKQGAAA